MNNNFFTKTILPVFFLLCVPGFVFADTITIAADPWIPHVGDEKGDKGYIIDIATAIFEEAGHEVEYLVLPWSRAIKNAREGTVNAIAACVPEEAEDFIYPDIEIGWSTYQYYFRNSFDWQYDSELESNSFLNVRMGVIAGYDYGESTNDYVAQNKRNKDRIHVFHGSRTLERMLRMIAMGRIDIINDEKLVVEHHLRRLGLMDEITAGGGEDESASLWIGFSPAIEKSSEYAKILSDGIKRYRKNGKFAEFLDRYGIKDWRSN